MVKEMYNSRMYKLIEHDGFNEGFGRNLRKGWDNEHLVLNLRRKLIRILELEIDNQVTTDWIIDIDFSNEGTKIGNDGVDLILSEQDNQVRVKLKSYSNLSIRKQTQKS